MIINELPQTRDLIEQGIARGLHIGAQLYVSISGKIVAELAIGEARPNVPMRSDSLVLWLSSCKPITAVAIMQQVEQGRLDLEAPVARYLPDFAQAGKQHITTSHLLTHTSGLSHVDIKPLHQSWDDIVAQIVEAPIEPGVAAGEKAAYQPLATWFVLGELIQTLSGRTLPKYVREKIFDPLDMPDSWIGMPQEKFNKYGERLAVLPNMQIAQQPPHPYSTPRGATACIPGGSGYGPIRELGHFYEMLLGGGQRNDVRILSADSVAQMTTRQRVGMFDETFQHKMDWGLGLIINSNQYGARSVPYGFGLHASEDAFGHGGAQSSVGFADPEHDLVVAVMLNGLPGEPKHQRRIREINTAIYEDLGISA